MALVLYRVAVTAAVTGTFSALLVTGTVVATRVVWLPVFTYVPRWVFQGAGDRDPILISWSGMRSAVSLAAALAVPLTTDAGTPFPERDLIVFLTFCVILAASCSKPSARRSSPFAATASSTTTSCTGSSATSIWRTRASTSNSIEVLKNPPKGVRLDGLVRLDPATHAFVLATAALTSIAFAFSAMNVLAVFLSHVLN